MSNLPNIEGIYPLVPLQKGLLFNSLYSPGSGVYSQQLRMTISGPLDAQIIKKAWEIMVQRHSTLRTSFIWEGQEQPVQVVKRSVKLPWQELDWRAFSETEQSEKFNELLLAERKKGFDFARAPLLRVTLIQTGDQLHELVVTSHHMILDGWSNSILVKELLSLVRLLEEGKEANGFLRPAPAYRDYIQWIQQQDPAQAESFWRKSLQAITGPTAIPEMQPGNVHGDAARQRSCDLRVNHEISGQLQRLAANCGVTVSMVLAGTWALLLSFFNDRQNVVFGLTVSGRPAFLAGVEDMTGLFINTLPLRVALPPEMLLSDWLRELQVHTLELQEYAHSDLLDVHQWSAMAPGRPLFESIFVFDNYPGEAAHASHAGKLSFRNIDSTSSGSFPLAIIATFDGALRLGITYDSSRLDGPAAGRLLDRYCTILGKLAGSFSRQLCEITALSSDESNQLVRGNNKTRCDYGNPACIHELFEKQAAASPEATALGLGEQEWTYRELNESANHLARYLQKKGVQPEHRVGVHLESSAHTVLAALAVLKAGAAYLPLDSAYPQQLLHHMVRDADVHVIITEEHLSANLPNQAACIVKLGAEQKDIDAESAGNLRSTVSTDNLAYIIYTSGSTGLPKGVAVTHRNAFNTIQWLIHTFSINSSDKILLAVPTSFDPSIGQIFSTLISGAELVCMKSGAHDAPYILGLLEKRQLTLLDLSPTMLAFLLSEGPPEKFSSVKRVLTGGEAMPTGLLAMLFSKLPVPFSNLYGPTETCINASSWTCAANTFVSMVPIGRPIANVQIYLLDCCFQPVPVGVPGEIFIGGAGVSRGYLNAPDLTAQKFIPDPHGERPGARLYQTGDLARYLPDGNIEFLGRVDSQVKIRGLRIEMGQVDSALKEHPEVREAAVVVRKNRNGEPLLVAYVSTHKPVSERDLNAYLKARLPGYMVPSIIVFLDQLPRLPNGKIDQKLLPDVVFESAAASARLPQNQWEGLLATIWASVLRCERVGIHDNFFALGGHSLLAVRVASKIQEAFGIEIPVRLIFEKPTIAELCGEIQALLQKTPEGNFTRPSSRWRGGNAPMSFAQRRLWFLDRLAPGGPFYNVPEALRLRGPLDVPALEQALGEILRRHAVLRTTFGSQNGELVQIISEDCAPRLHFNDLTSLQPDEKPLEARRLADLEARCPFDLEQGPMVRTTLLKPGDEDHVLLLTLHHIVADGGSAGIIEHELSILYRASVEHVPGTLHELPLQYADFAIWEQERLQGPAFDQKVNYWKQQLAGASGVLELSTDLPRPAAQGFSGSSCEFAVPPETVRLLKQLGLQESATSFMILLAAFNTLLYRYTSQPDILVGSPVAGRAYSELEDLVGLFVNTIVLRTDLSGAPSFRELLRRVRSTTLSAYSNQEVPFERVIEETNPARDLSRSPLFQVMFSFQQLGTRLAPDFGNLEVVPFGIDPGTAKFDLELLMNETSSDFKGVFEFSTDLFFPETIATLAAHFCNLLQAITEDSDCPVSRLTILDEKERREIIEHFSAGPKAELPELCFPQIFERQVEMTPDHPAVLAEDGALTYRQLNQSANSIAHSLMNAGLKCEMVVAVLADRGSILLSCMLGIWKSGGTYLPLDPRYPARALAQMMEQARVEVVIATHGWKELLSATVAQVQTGLNIEVLSAETLMAAPAKQNPISGGMPENLAYVIFTSGSTGTPKGAMVEHKGMLNHLLAKVTDLNLGPQDVVAQTASQCFDISIWQFLAALAAGGRTHVCSNAIAYNPLRLLEEIEQGGISILEVVPSLLRPILDEVERAPKQFSLPSLKWLVPTGEALPPDLAGKWLEHYPAIPLMNAYGPTECSDDITHWPIHRALPKDVISVPIGKPVRNMSLYVLDAEMQLVPRGVPGELFVSGIGVGRGYLHNPEQTVLAFCPGPLPGDANNRLYRSGDRARFLRGGELEFLGRVDHQVKVRGFRVELGESEFRLRQHPDVRDCVVVSSKDAEGNTQLVAYVVLGQQQIISVEDLRDFMKLSVPDYMVPSLVLFLERLPLTPTGKVDRKALPEPDLSLTARPPLVSPETEIERRLVRLWERMLKTSPVGVHDNFFDLGGHSIMALRLMGEIQDRFGRKLPLTTLFQHGTIKKLAAILQDTFPESTAVPLIAMQPSGSNPPLFFVHVGSGEVTCYVELMRHLDKNQPFYGLQDPNLYSDSIMQMTIEERAALYLDVVQSVQPRGPYFLGGWSFGGVVAFEMARQLHVRGETVGLLALIDTGSPELVRHMAPTDDDTPLLGIIGRELNLPVTDAELNRCSTLDDQFQLLIGRMKDAGIHWQDSVQFLERQLAIFKSRNRAIRRYVPSPYTGLISFFRASEEYIEDPSAWPDIAREPARGFAALTTQPIDLHMIPGKHHMLAREPGVSVLAAALSRCVQKSLEAIGFYGSDNQAQKLEVSVS